MTTLLQTSIESDVRDQATAILTEQGLSMDVAVTILLKRIIAEHGFPIDLLQPNAETLEAMEEIKQGGGTRYASVAEMFADLDAAE